MFEKNKTMRSVTQQPLNMVYALGFARPPFSGGEEVAEAGVGLGLFFR